MFLNYVYFLLKISTYVYYVSKVVITSMIGLKKQ